MKDDKEHIDPLFKSLNDRQFEIPEAFLEDLNKRLDNEPKRKPFFLWFLVPLGVIGAIGIFYFQYSGNSGSPVNGGNKSISKNEHKEDLSAQNQHNQYATDSNPTQGQPVKTQNAQIKQSSKLKTSSRKPGSEIHPGKQTAWIAPEKNETLHAKTSRTKAANIPDSGKEEKIPDPEPAGTASLTVKPGKEELSKESVPQAGKDSLTAQNTVDTLQQADSNTAEKETTLPKDEPKSKASANNWRKEIQLFAGLGGNSVHDSPGNPEYMAKINQNQTSILAPSFGVNANLSYKKLTFGSGISYQQTGEKFKADVINIVSKDSTYSEFIQDTVWVQDTTGNWIPTIHDTTIYHTVQYTDSAWISRSFHNRYSWISIPLHFGYRFELGDYELIPRIGAVFNFGIAGSGTYPNTSFNNTRQYPPAKFTVSYLIQLEARRSFSRWFVFVNPYFRSMVNPAISGDVIRRRYTSWGMEFGIGVNL